MKFNYSTFIIFIVVFMHFICSPTRVYSKSALPFFEDFESERALTKWDKIGDAINVKSIEGSEGHILKIERKNAWDFTRIRRDFYGIKGTVIIEADIQAENIIQGVQSYYKGILQAVIIIDGKEMGYVNDEFTGTFGLTRKRIEVNDLSGKEIVAVRIGLQNAKGSMLVDNIKVYQP